VNIIESAEEMQQKDLVFTEYAQVELHTISGAVKEISDLALTAFLKEDFNAAYSVEPLEQIIDELKEVLRTNHIMRLQVGSCSIVAGFVWSDLLTDLERCSDHCSNIAFTMMERKQQNFNLHESVRKFRRENPAFQEKVQEYREKYALRVQQ
jgi:phosphate:Na+ symporter